MSRIPVHSQSSSTPRRPHRPSSKEAAAAVAAMSRSSALGQSSQRPRCPIHPASVPALAPSEESDASLRTSRVARDSLSGDSLEGVVACGMLAKTKVARAGVMSGSGRGSALRVGDAAERVPGAAPVQRQMLQQLLQQHHCSCKSRMVAGQSSGLHADVSANNAESTRPLNATQRRDTHHRHSPRSPSPSDRPLRRRSSPSALEDYDASELLQLLIGQVYGTDSQRVRCERKLVDSQSFGSACSYNNLEALVGSFCSAAEALNNNGDRSEQGSDLLTLTGGGISKSLLATEQHLLRQQQLQLQALQQAISSNTDIIANTAVAVPAVPALVPAPPTVTLSAAGTSKSSRRRPTSKESQQSRTGAADGSAAPWRSSNAGSNLSLAGSEVAVAPSNAAATTMAESAGPDGIAASDVLTGGSSTRGHNDITMESNVWLDLGDFSAARDAATITEDDNSNAEDTASISNAEGGRAQQNRCICCGYSSTGGARINVSQRRAPFNHTNGSGGRYGRLRTPEACKRTQSTGAATTATAAEVEWSDRRANIRDRGDAGSGGGASTSERQRIAPSDASDCSAASKRRQASSPAPRSRRRQGRVVSVSTRKSSESAGHRRRQTRRARQSSSSRGKRRVEGEGRKGTAEKRASPGRKGQEKEKKKLPKKNKPATRRRNSRDS